MQNSFPERGQDCHPSCQVQELSGRVEKLEDVINQIASHMGLLHNDTYAGEVDPALPEVLEAASHEIPYVGIQDKGIKALFSLID